MTVSRNKRNRNSGSKGESPRCRNCDVVPAYIGPINTVLAENLADAFGIDHFMLVARLVVPIGARPTLYVVSCSFNFETAALGRTANRRSLRPSRFRLRLILFGTPPQLSRKFSASEV